MYEPHNPIRGNLHRGNLAVVQDDPKICGSDDLPLYRKTAENDSEHAHNGRPEETAWFFWTGSTLEDLSFWDLTYWSREFPREEEEPFNSYTLRLVHEAAFVQGRAAPDELHEPIELTRFDDIIGMFESQLGKVLQLQVNYDPTTGEPDRFPFRSEEGWYMAFLGDKSEMGHMIHQVRQAEGKRYFDPPCLEVFVGYIDNYCRERLNVYHAKDMVKRVGAMMMVKVHEELISPNFYSPHRGPLAANANRFYPGSFWDEKTRSWLYMVDLPDNQHRGYPRVPNQEEEKMNDRPVTIVVD